MLLDSLVIDWVKLVYAKLWWNLMDLPFVGGTFTWSNNQESSSWSIIDRLLVSPEWKA
jgi:hypothetical protein